MKSHFNLNFLYKINHFNKTYIIEYYIPDLLNISLFVEAEEELVLLTGVGLPEELSRSSNEAVGSAAFVAIPPQPAGGPGVRAGRRCARAGCT